MSRLVAKTVLVGLVTACMQISQVLAGAMLRVSAPTAALHGSHDNIIMAGQVRYVVDVGKGLLEQSSMQSRCT